MPIDRFQLESSKKHRKSTRHSHDKWNPKKRLLRYQMEHLRTLRYQQPDVWTIPKLAKAFQISRSAVTRILRSKFEPPLEVQERQDAKAKQLREERRQRQQEMWTNLIDSTDSKP